MLAAAQPDLRPVTANARRLLNTVGGASLLGIFAMYLAHQPVRARSSTEGGMVLLAVLTALLIIASPSTPASHWRSILGWEPLPVGRGAVVRHLPVALPGHRPHHAAQRTAQRGAGHPPDRRHPRDRRAVLALRRATGPARRPRARSGSASGATMDVATVATRRAGCWSAASSPTRPVRRRARRAGVGVGRRPHVPGHEHRSGGPPAPGPRIDAAHRTAPTTTTTRRPART